MQQRSDQKVRGEDPVLPARLTRWGALALGAVLAGCFGVLTYVNCFWASYPNDNDLDEVGWIAAHLSFGRAESFANQGYPPGLPVVLRLITPLVGSFLRATFLWQSLAATASLFFVFQITRALSRSWGAGALALFCAALAGLPVYTSEFADGTSTALFLGGFWLLTRHGASRRGFFLLGLSAGLAYLFRTHYLILIALVPTSLLMAGFGLREALKAALPFVAGFSATACPLWLANTLAYGTPLHAGVSQYNIALAVVPGAFSWEDYPNTYNRWPLSAILREYPNELLTNSLNQALTTLGMKLSVAAAAAGAFAAALAGDTARRRWLAFGGVLALLYVLVVIVPTRYTDRAYAPVAMLASVLLASGLAELIARTRRPRWNLAWAALAVAFVNYPAGMWDQLQAKARDARWNTKIVRKLEANGMQSGDEVFSNVWNFYPMTDPRFVTFYNFGGWIELDSLYARERPHPTARSVEEWQAFFAEHGIRFAILRNRDNTRELFRRTPESWRELYSDRNMTVWALEPAPEAQPEAKGS